MCLGYIVLQLSCITTGAACNFISPVKYVSYLYISTFRSVCALLLLLLLLLLFIIIIIIIITIRLKIICVLHIAYVK